MHRDNTYLTNRPLGQTSGTESPVPSPESAPGGQLLPADSSHVPSAELLDLIDQVQQAPTVRPEAVQRAAARLASGYYLSRAAAEQTAEAIQQAQE